MLDPKKLGVLVHCLAGISRSVTIVVAYLMSHYTLAMDDAYEMVKARRPAIAPNFNFMGQLLEFQNQIFTESLKKRRAARGKIQRHELVSPPHEADIATALSGLELEPPRCESAKLERSSAVDCGDSAFDFGEGCSGGAKGGDGNSECDKDTVGDDSGYREKAGNEPDGGYGDKGDSDRLVSGEHSGTRTVTSTTIRCVRETSSSITTANSADDRIERPKSAHGQGSERVSAAQVKNSRSVRSNLSTSSSNDKLRLLQPPHLVASPHGGGLQPLPLSSQHGLAGRRYSSTSSGGDFESGIEMSTESSPGVFGGATPMVVSEEDRDGREDVAHELGNSGETHTGGSRTAAGRSGTLCRSDKGSDESMKCDDRSTAGDGDAGGSERDTDQVDAEKHTCGRDDGTDGKNGITSGERRKPPLFIPTSDSSGAAASPTGSGRAHWSPTLASIPPRSPGCCPNNPSSPGGIFSFPNMFANSIKIEE